MPSISGENWSDRPIRQWLKRHIRTGSNSDFDSSMPLTSAVFFPIVFEPCTEQMSRRTPYTAVTVPWVLNGKFASSFPTVSDSCHLSITILALSFAGIVEPIPNGQPAKDYLEQNVNKTLIKALTALCKEKPDDPVVGFYSRQWSNIFKCLSSISFSCGSQTNWLKLIHTNPNWVKWKCHRQVEKDNCRQKKVPDEKLSLDDTSQSELMNFHFSLCLDFYEIKQIYIHSMHLTRKDKQMDIYVSRTALIYEEFYTDLSENSERRSLRTVVVF
jgi:hypothetical protein